MDLLDVNISRDVPVVARFASSFSYYTGIVGESVVGDDAPIAPNARLSEVVINAKPIRLLACMFWMGLAVLARFLHTIGSMPR